MRAVGRDAHIVAQHRVYAVPLQKVDGRIAAFEGTGAPEVAVYWNALHTEHFHVCVGSDPDVLETFVREMALETFPLGVSLQDVAVLLPDPDLAVVE